MIPTYRGSQLDNFQTCPFSFACGLLRQATKACQTDTEVEAYLSAYCCPEGVHYILENCGSAPMPLMSRMTQIGIQFHAFAHAYGAHLKREGMVTDWQAADSIARGMATVDGKFVKSLHDTMTFWFQQFEANPAPITLSEGDTDLSTSGALAIELATGSHERGHQTAFTVDGKPALYVMHPDFAKLSGDQTRLTIMDWKSGLRSETFDPDRPNVQLLRYAWAFARLFPTITEVELHLVFVNPQHPLSDEPLVWQRDLQDLEISDEIVTAPVAAISVAPEFRSSVGCWLCDGYCEWAMCCDESDAVQRVCAVTPETALAAYEAHGDTYRVSKMLSAKRGQLKHIFDAYVEQNGPLVVGEQEDGTPLVYGPRKQLVASVSDTARLVQELQAMDRPDLIRKLKLEDAKGFAQEAGVSRPFTKSPVPSLRLKWRIGRSVEGTPDEDFDAPVEEDENPGRRVLAQEAPAPQQPRAKSEFEDAF
jgi:hypothetical protein